MNCALGGGLTSFRVGPTQPSGGVGRGRRSSPALKKNKQIHVSKGESGPCCCLALQMRGKMCFWQQGRHASLSWLNIGKRGLLPLPPPIKSVSPTLYPYFSIGEMSREDLDLLVCTAPSPSASRELTLPDRPHPPAPGGGGHSCCRSVSQDRGGSG